MRLELASGSNCKTCSLKVIVSISIRNSCTKDAPISLKVWCFRSLMFRHLFFCLFLLFLISIFLMKFVHDSDLYWQILLNVIFPYVNGKENCIMKPLLYRKVSCLEFDLLIISAGEKTWVIGYLGTSGQNDNCYCRRGSGERARAAAPGHG